MRLFLPDHDDPGRAGAEAEGSAFRQLNAILVPYLETADIASTALYLASS